MVKKISLSVVVLVLFSSPLLSAGEDFMPMHPGDGSFNEVGFGIAVSPTRRATSEDAPAPSRRPERPLHKNKVTLKLPAPPTLGESRLRIVDVTDTGDGSLDFNLEGAPLLDNNMDIPGLISPEQLAMDKFNQLEADPPRRQDESFARNERSIVQPAETGRDGSESAFAAAISPMQRIGPSSFPDPEELPPSRRIILNPASGAVQADRPTETAQRVALPPPIRPSEEPSAAFAAEPASAFALAPLAPPDLSAQATQSLRPPATVLESVQPPASIAQLRPDEFGPEPAMAAIPLPEPLSQDAPDESFFVSPPEMATLPSEPAAPAYAAGMPQLPQPMETRYSEPYQAEPARNDSGNRQTLMAYEAPARAVPAARVRDYSSSRPIAEVHAAKPAIRAYEVPMPPAPPASRERPEYDAPRMESGMAAARSSMAGNEVSAYEPPVPERREQAVRERAVQERPVSVPGAGASKRSPRFRRNVARFDTHAQSEASDAAAMRELKNTLDPIYRQGER